MTIFENHYWIPASGVWSTPELKWDILAREYRNGVLFFLVKGCNVYI